jgi:hypothetical protein
MAEADFWNPDTTQQAQAQAPQAWWQQAGRESHHYHQVPDALKQIAGWQSIVNDPGADPQAWAQQQYAAQREANPATTDAGDASVFTAAPQAQSPAQQWNAQPAAPTAAAPAAPTTGTGDALVQQLMERARQGIAVDRTDPTIRAQVDPYAANVERSRRNYLGDLAERAGPYANLRGEERMSAERAGQASGLFEAEVIGREVSARRDEIAQALQMWGSLLTNDQRVALERELAMLNDRARTADRSTTQDQFLRELALREWMAMDDSAFRWQTGGV